MNQDFDSIRPYAPEELPEVFDRLIAEEQFRKVVAFIFPDVPFEALAAKMRACKTSLDFQRRFAIPSSKGCCRRPVMAVTSMLRR